MITYKELRLLNEEMIKSIHKVINKNGCWIPLIKPYDDGYVHIKINRRRYSLHRLSMCIFYNRDYYDAKVDTRHSEICSRACFNPEHLKPGSTRDNALDAVEYGKHRNASKDKCPKCGGIYKQYRIKSGPRKGELFRECTNCKNEARRLRWRNKHGK